MKKFLIDCTAIYSNALQTLKLPKIAPTSYHSISLPPSLPHLSLPPSPLPPSPPSLSPSFPTSGFIHLLHRLWYRNDSPNPTQCGRHLPVVDGLQDNLHGSIGLLTTTVKCILTYCGSHPDLSSVILCLQYTEAWEWWCMWRAGNRWGKYVHIPINSSLEHP